jgi:hypothetical protein
MSECTGDDTDIRKQCWNEKGGSRGYEPPYGERH